MLGRVSAPSTDARLGDDDIGHVDRPIGQAGRLAGEHRDRFAFRAAPLDLTRPTAA
ncbi:hypothetical protein [Maricaulis maris]|uniref:Uncharacterized protein n=1 Tax=Maricaulis maris TaxID=74318 RepID=A0A495D1H7_9PROT|nr:hypothetical protein [Maricaulis maris]RKQ95337.1 hypothetical protein C7435_3031 [Maricaulis maris]